MTTTANSIVTDEKTKTVTIRQETFSLQEGTFRKGYRHVVYATTVEAKQGFINPGSDLTVYAARFVVDSAGGKIDLSGEDEAPIESKRPDANTFKTPSLYGGDGGKGEDGKPGGAGGDIAIYAAKMLGGTFELVSRGGNGSRAQDGGNGKDGAQPEEDKNLPQRPKQVVVERVGDTPGQEHSQDRTDWGDDVDKAGKDSTGAYLLVARNSPKGSPGGNGGNAGVAGKPGDGGSGGRIRLFVTHSNDIKSDVGGGYKGGEAKNGNPGSGASGGLGRRYLYKADAGMVQIDWSAYNDDDKWDKHWNTKNSTTLVFFGVDHFKDLGVKSDYIVWDGEYKKLKLRADSGPNGRNGGYGSNGDAKAPAIPTATAGARGSFACEPVDSAGDIFREIPYPYLLMLQRSATASLLNRDIDEAADILRWLMLLTSGYRNARENDPEDVRNRQRLYCEAEQALLTRDRDDAATGRAARCVYKDIERYSDFIEQALDHITSREKNFRSL